MSSLGMLALFAGTITPDQEATSGGSVSAPTAPATPSTQPVNIRQPVNRSNSYSPNVFYSSLPSPREVIARYLFGYRAASKTKRTLAEEAECGDEVSVCTWIRDGSDPNEADHYGYTPLLNAAALGRLNAVESLIKSGADVNRHGPYGFTPLHAAAQNGHRECVAALLKAGADVNSQNEDKDTPMHLALRAMHIEVVNILLRNGGSSNIPGFMAKDCVQCAKEVGLVDLARSLVHYNSPVRQPASNFSTPNLGLSH